MKLRNIFAAIFSLALVATGCVKEEPTTLKEIQLSETYVSIPATGGEVKVTVNATTAWKLKDIYAVTTKDADGNKVTNNYPTPTWLSVDKTSGSAGETVLTFSAAADNAGHEAEIQFEAGLHTQFLMVRQGEMTASSATCAEIIAGADGKTYRVKGVCREIYNTTYGNWYLNDGTGEITIYGTLDAKGAEKNFASLGIEAGDVVEVEGPKTTYVSSSGDVTHELVNVTVIKIEKSLIKVVSPEATVPATGGDIEVKVAHKAAGALVDIPEEATSWINYVSSSYKTGVATKIEPNPADTTIFKFKVQPTAGSGRTATLTFKAGVNGKSSVTYKVAQVGNPSTIAEIFTKGPGNYLVEKAVVMAKAGSNVIISDGTANIMVYSSGNTLEVGDCIKLDGAEVSERSGLLQFGSPKFEVLKEKATPEYGTPVEIMTEDDVKNWGGNPQYQYIHFQGVMGTDNRTIKVLGSDYGIYIAATEGYAGKTVNVYGYANGKASSYKTITTTLVSIEEGAAPSYPTTLAHTSWKQGDDDGFAIAIFTDASNGMIVNGDGEDGIWWDEISNPEEVTFTYTYDPSTGKGSINSFNFGELPFEFNEEGDMYITMGEDPFGPFVQIDYVEPQLPGGGDDEKPSFETTVSYALGANAYDDGVATVNGTENVKTIKIGSSKNAGNFNVTVPAGTTSVSFYAVAWRGATTSVVVKNGETTVAEQAVAANDGATGNAPYTLTVADSDYYTINVNATAETTLNLSASARVIFFGVQAK